METFEFYFARYKTEGHLELFGKYTSTRDMIAIMT